MRDLMHRIGALEARVDMQTRQAEAHAEADEKSHDDHERRIRAQEFLTAKVVGGAIVGAAVGGWILNQLANVF